MRLVLFISALIFISCSPGSTGPIFIPSPTPSPTPESNLPEEPSQSVDAAREVRLAWGHPEWTRHLMGLVRPKVSAWDLAQDWKRFCPRYRSLPDDKRAEVMAHLIVAIAKFESAYNPDTVYHEPPPLSVDSIGLLQLSYGDKFCPKNKAEGNLKDPYVNLTCAVKIMEYWIERDEVIQNSNHHGLARYWSVIRNGKRVSSIANIVGLVPGCQ